MCPRPPSGYGKLHQSCASPSLPEVGAGCVSAHVRIYAGGAGQPASLPRHSNASGFRTAANDLQQIMNALASGRSVPVEHAARLFAYTLSLTVLRALSAECMLKAVALARSGSFEREHDLSRLYAALDDGIKLHIERVADSYGVASVLSG